MKTLILILVLATTTPAMSQVLNLDHSLGGGAAQDLIDQFISQWSIGTSSSGGHDVPEGMASRDAMMNVCQIDTSVLSTTLSAFSAQGYNCAYPDGQRYGKIFCLDGDKALRLTTHFGLVDDTNPASCLKVEKVSVEIVPMADVPAFQLAPGKN